MASNIEQSLCWGCMVVVLMVLSSVRDCNAQDCGGYFTNLEGTITSPLYPNTYTDNMECVYIINAPDEYRITLTFLDFFLEPDIFCSYDFLEVYDGGSLTSPLLGSRFCGYTLPPVQRTSQNVMLILFSTDESGTYPGFNASYTSAIIPIEFVLLAKNGFIFRADIVTLSYTRVVVPSTVGNGSIPIAVYYDPVDDRVYWTDVLLKEIRSIFSNGSDNTLVQSLNTVSSPDGMAVDSQSRLVFYTDVGNKIIALIMISTFEHRFLITTKLDRPRAIVLDTINGIMFWSDWGTSPKIERANYDGSDRIALVSTDLILPNGLALDTTNDRLYWADGWTGKLEFVNTMGNFRTKIYSSLINTHYFGLALYNDKLYITDWTSEGALTNMSYIERINTDGTNFTTIISSMGRFNGIHIYSANTSKPELNACGLNIGRCSHICIPLPGNVTKCLCPDGQYLLPDQETCSYATTSTATVVPSTTTHVTKTTTITTEASVSVITSSVTTASVTTTTNNTTSSVSDTSSTKSIAFSSTSSQSAATSPRPPGTVTIKVNKPFATDGTYELNLTCEYSDVILVKEFAWNVQCLRKQNGTCTLQPRPPEDDGKTVTCTVTDVFGQSATTAVDLELNYPPPSPPVINGYHSGDILQTGSSLKMTCSVKGGKPLAEIVLFSCPAHLDTPDISGQNEMLSSLSINPIRASDDGTICVCTAVWKQETLYRLSDSKTLKVNGTESESGPSGSIPGIVGGSVVGVCVLIFVIAIVVITIKKRKSSQLYDRPQPPKQRDSELTDPYTICNQQFQDNDSDEYDSIGNVTDIYTELSPERVQSTHAVPCVNHDFLQPLYEVNQQTPSDKLVPSVNHDYLQPLYGDNQQTSSDSLVPSVNHDYLQPLYGDNQQTSSDNLVPSVNHDYLQPLYGDNQQTSSDNLVPSVNHDYLQPLYGDNQQTSSDNLVPSVNHDYLQPLYGDNQQTSSDNLVPSVNHDYLQPLYGDIQQTSSDNLGGIENTGFITDLYLQPSPNGESVPEYFIPI